MATAVAERHACELSQEEGEQLFDRAARHYLNMSGEEFLRAWDAGHFDDPDQPDIMAVAMLLPFAREGASKG